MNPDYSEEAWKQLSDELENFQELAAKAQVEDIPAGKVLFKKGDLDRKTIYLLSGEVLLLNENGGVAGAIRGGSKEARHPIANQQPRQLKNCRLSVPTKDC